MQRFYHLTLTAPISRLLREELNWLGYSVYLEVRFPTDQTGESDVRVNTYSVYVSKKRPNQTELLYLPTVRHVEVISPRLLPEGLVKLISVDHNGLVFSDGD